MKVIDKKRKDLKMKEEIKNATILEKTVRPDKAQMLKRVQHDMGWFRCGFGALAPDKNLSLFTSHLSPKDTLTSHFSRIAAFTLAEVLITLGIIGVVAALTIPSLIQKFNNKAFETALKKQLTIVQSTLEYINIEKCLSQCYITLISDPNRQGNMIYSANISDCKAIVDELVSAIKLKPLKNNYSNIYSSSTVVFANGGLSTNRSVDYGTALSKLNAYYSPDGTVYFLSENSVYCVIDVNGKKGPNKWGYDVFWLTFSRVGNSDKIRLTDEWATLVEKGGKFPRTILTNGKESTEDDVNGFTWK